MPPRNNVLHTHKGCSRNKAAWVCSVTDPNRFKLTQEELLQKKMLLISKHNILESEVKRTPRKQTVKSSSASNDDSRGVVRPVQMNRHDLDYSNSTCNLIEDMEETVDLHCASRSFLRKSKAAALPQRQTFETSSLATAKHSISDEDMAEIACQIKVLHKELLYFEQVSGSRSSIFDVEELEIALDITKDSQHSYELNLKRVIRFLTQLVCQSMSHLLKAEVQAQQQQTNYNSLSDRLDALTKLVMSPSAVHTRDLMATTTTISSAALNKPKHSRGEGDAHLSSVSAAQGRLSDLSVTTPARQAHADATAFSTDNTFSSPFSSALSPVSTVSHGLHSDSYNDGHDDSMITVATPLLTTTDDNLFQRQVHHMSGSSTSDWLFTRPDMAAAASSSSPSLSSSSLSHARASSSTSRPLTGLIFRPTTAFHTPVHSTTHQASPLSSSGSNSSSIAAGSRRLHLGKQLFTEEDHNHLDTETRNTGRVQDHEASDTDSASVHERESETASGLERLTFNRHATAGADQTEKVITARAAQDRSNASASASASAGVFEEERAQEQVSVTSTMMPRRAVPKPMFAGTAVSDSLSHITPPPPSAQPVRSSSRHFHDDLGSSAGPNTARGSGFGPHDVLTLDSKYSRPQYSYDARNGSF